MTAALNRLKAIVGTHGWIEAPEDVARYATDYRRLYGGPTPIVLRPGSTAEVASIVATCAKAGLAIVPQGGNTSLVGGSVPTTHGGEVILNLERLAAVQAAAAEAGQLFPLRLGSQGTCQIGGNLSTNAGGSNVLHYGNARDLVLGLEVVLADGTVWDGLRALRKDNTGYNLKQLFIGAEGTLGIITAAVLKLSPQPKAVETAFLAVPDVDAAVALLNLAKDSAQYGVTAFELMSRVSIDLAQARLAGGRTPLPLEAAGWFVLLEIVGGWTLKNALMALLTEAQDQGLLLDGVVAGSLAQAEEFWRLREEISDAQTAAGGSVRCDIAVPISRMADFIMAASLAVRKIVPDARIIAYGHVGDGNVHFNPMRAAEAEPEEFLRHAPAISHVVDDIAHALGGSISAEHGVGQAKRDELPRYKSQVELDLYRRIKRALDPRNTMNPGKLLAQARHII